MDNLQTLRKLIDEEAIDFMIKNEKEFETLYKSFLNTNRIIGIDLASKRDEIGYPRSKKIAF